jgi:predicted ATPase
MVQHTQMIKQKVVNLFAGPGAGKSTMAAALFAELKFRGVNCELVTEYTKENEWEGRTGKIRKAQDYLFSKQHFRLSRVSGHVSVIITDAPLLIGLAYADPSYLPSLFTTITEAHARFDNLNVFVRRPEAYHAIGRSQTLEEAKILDQKILGLMPSVDYQVGYGREFVDALADRVMFFLGD